MKKLKLPTEAQIETALKFMEHVEPSLTRDPNETSNLQTLKDRMSAFLIRHKQENKLTTQTIATRVNAPVPFINKILRYDTEDIAVKSIFSIISMLIEE